MICERLSFLVEEDDCCLPLSMSAHFLVFLLKPFWAVLSQLLKDLKLCFLEFCGTDSILLELSETQEKFWGGQVGHH